MKKVITMIALSCLSASVAFAAPKITQCPEASNLYSSLTSPASLFDKDAAELDVIKNATNIQGLNG